MHDMMQELAHFVTEKHFVIMEVEGADHEQTSSRNYGDVYHFMLLLKNTDAQIPTSILEKKKNLRILFVVHLETSTPSNPLSCDLFVKLTCLKTLSLRHCNIEQLPKEIDKLVHLRYVNLSGNSFKELPNSLCNNLFNLVTLQLKGCTQLERLPNQMGKLESLQHLYVEGCDKLEALPKEIGSLTSLQTLDMFILPSFDYLQRGKEALNLEDLSKLKDFQGHIQLFMCGNLEDGGDLTQGTQLVHNVNRRNYVDLKLNFEGSSNKGTINEKSILEALKPHSDLTSLEIRGGEGTNCPNWIDSLTHLRRVVIVGCRNNEFCPHLDSRLHLRLSK